MWFVGGAQLRADGAGDGFLVLVEGPIGSDARIAGFDFSGRGWRSFVFFGEERGIIVCGRGIGLSVVLVGFGG